MNLFSNFDYGTQPVRTVVLTGLSPNTAYDVVLYEKQWDNSLNRSFQVGYDVGATGTPQYTAPWIDQNQPQNTPALAALGITQQSAWAQSYVYATGPGQTSIALDINNPYANSYHFYGLTNQVAAGGLPGTSFPNTNVAVTAGTTLAAAAGSATFGDLTMSAPLTLSAVAGGTPFTFHSINSTADASLLSDAAGNAQLVIPTGGISVSGGKTLTVGAQILNNAASTPLVLSGPGTVVMANGNNSYAGGTNVTGGTLLLNVAGGTPVGSGPLTVGSGATVGHQRRAQPPRRPYRGQSGGMFGRRRGHHHPTSPGVT